MIKQEAEQLQRVIRNRLKWNIDNRTAHWLLPIFLFAKKSLQIKRKIGVWYERQVAPFLALHLFWLFWPTYKIFKIRRLCFVVNIGGGVGHIICELDQFFRQQILGELDKSKRYIWLRKNDLFSKACIDLYGHRFASARCNSLLYYLLLPILIRCRDITHDAGLSRLKWDLNPLGKYGVPAAGQTYLYQVSKEEGIGLWIDYYRRCGKTKGYYPLKIELQKNRSLEPLLSGTPNKIVLVQLKDRAKNASPSLTDPLTYCPAIEYLQSLSYTVIFAGRERMPKLFNDRGVVNYAESPIASFKNDIYLYSLATFSINAGSGVAFLADSYDRPYLYVNSWQLLMSMFSPKCVAIPALVQNREGRLLKFSEQLSLYRDRVDDGDEHFPTEEYTPRNATGDEILEAVKELAVLCHTPSPRSELQERYRTLDHHTPLFHAEARVSDYFLKRHIDLF